MIDKKDLKVRWYSGTGAGGQHRNRTQNCCEVTHIPTCISATGQNSRSRLDNYNEAVSSIEAQLADTQKLALAAKIQEYRQAAIDTGTIRTYNFQRGTVKDHRSNKEADLDRFMDGKIDFLKFSLE